MNQSGFSLVEILVATVLLSIAAVGLTATLRFIDYQMLIARIDRRADRVLRGYYEFQAYAPASVRSSGPPPSGVLYQPLASTFARNLPGSSPSPIPYILISDGANVTLTYSVPAIVPSGTPRQLAKTVSLNGSPAP